MRGVALAVGIVAVGAGALAMSCGAPSEVTGASKPSPLGDASTEADTRDAFHARRIACEFDAGALTQDTVGPDIPDLSKLEHVVVVMLENRSFDHLLSELDGLDPEDKPASDASEPALDGRPVHRYPESAFCPGPAELPAHEWSDVHLQLAGGRMDGFVATSDCRAMGYYGKKQLPVMYRLAEEGAVSARYFSSLLGPTWPNRFFLFTGTSCGLAEGFDSNTRTTTVCGVGAKSWFNHLDGVEVFDESSVAAVTVGSGLFLGVPSSIGDFEQRAGAGTLPKISFVGGSTGTDIPFFWTAPTEDDGHPPSDIRRTEGFLYRIATAVMKGPKWPSTALFITYDEHGGYYDHVKPPAACPPEGGPSWAQCPPDGIVPHDGGTPVRDYGFCQYGFRVPLIVLSPYARRGYVSHIDADHTSILRFLEHWQHKGALTARDANAWPLFDLFDFTQPPRLPFSIDPPPDPGACDTGVKPTCP